MPEVQEPVPIRKIQEVSSVKMASGKPAAEVYDAGKFSTEEQAEHLWGFYTDYRRQEAEIRRKAVAPSGPLGKQWETVSAGRKSLDTARQKCGYFYEGGKLMAKAGANPAAADVEAYKVAYSAAIGARNRFDKQLLGLVAGDPDAQNTIQKIQALWGEPEAQKAFRESYTVVEKQRVSQRKEAAEYGFLRQHIREARDRFFGLLQKKYVNGRAAPMTLQVDIDLAEDSLKIAQEKVDEVIRPQELTRENTDRAALGKYQDIQEYATDFQTKRFIWSPSRLRLLDTITKHLANMVPTMLVGEAGTGKTQLARTAARLLQGESPRYVAGAPYTPAKSELAGVQEVDQKGTKWTFGELVAAATGHQGSDEMKAHLNEIGEAVKKGVFKAAEAVGSIIFIDEANLFDPGAFESYIKSIVGLRPGENFRMGALPGVSLKIAEKGFGMLLAINQADARYSNRNEFPPSLARLFRNGWTEVDYPEMEIGEIKDGKQENKCELFDMLLSALMTRDRRLLLAPSQIQPAYEDIDVDRVAGTHTKVVDMSKTNFFDYTEEGKKKAAKEPNHGALFRFALLVRATNDLFSEKKVTLPGETRPLPDQDKLTYTVLDLGVVMTWMSELGNKAGIDLHYELWQRLRHFSQTIPKTASEDGRVFRKLAAAYGFDLSLPREAQSKPYSQVLAAKEIGYLSPEVPRPILKKGEELGPKNKAFFDEKGVQHLIDVNSLTVEAVDTRGGNEKREFSEGTDVEVKFGGATKSLKFLGVDQKNGWAVFSEDRATILNPMQFPIERFESMVKRGEIKRL